MHQKIIDDFIDHLWLEDGLSKNTLNSYRFDLIIFDSWLGEQKKITMINNVIRFFFKKDRVNKSSGLIKNGSCKVAGICPEIFLYIGKI